MRRLLSCRGQSTVAKYMTKKGDPSGQSWGTFLRNHMPQIAAMDLFVVPTISFDLLHVLVIVRLARRELVWINVTTHPTAVSAFHSDDRAGFSGTLVSNFIQTRLGIRT
jgi:hypothetical protein